MKVDNSNEEIIVVKKCSTCSLLAWLDKAIVCFMLINAMGFGTFGAILMSVQQPFEAFCAFVCAIINVAALFAIYFTGKCHDTA